MTIVQLCEGTAKIQAHGLLSPPAHRQGMLPTPHRPYCLCTQPPQQIQSDDCGDISASCGCQLLPGEGVLPGHWRKEPHSSIHMDTIKKLATTYHSLLLFGDLEVECFRTSMAQRLIRILQICAGHVPGLSALNLLSMMKPSLEPILEEM
ncbi:centromere protein M isoform X6 [Notamacropus eugenii]